MADHEVHQMLALSTGHVTDETRQLLDNDGVRVHDCVVVTFTKSDHGWFIPVLDSKNPFMPDDLKQIFAFARTHGYTWLMFDNDAEPVDELPLYPW